MSDHIERLHVAEDSDHNPAEAAIHIARYALARPFVQGCRVLDISCGEGYGSRLMARDWGAASVVGVDISEESIAAAQRAFKADNLEFCVGEAERLTDAFNSGSFDVAVSLETIEHVADPVQFLRGLRHSVRPDGVIIISCPNDRWYYPSASESNPYHRRKFTEEEFRCMVTSVLGEPDVWLLGTAMSGFINWPVTAEASDSTSQGLASLADLPTVLVSPNQAVSSASCSYFVGIWGVGETRVGATAAGYPMSMEHSEFGVWRASEQVVTQALSEVGRMQLALTIREQENAIIRESQGMITTHHIQRYEDAMAAQAVMIDERDAYISQLEARVNGQTELLEAMQARVTSLEGSIAVRLRKRLPQRPRRDQR